MNHPNTSPKRQNMTRMIRIATASALSVLAIVATTTTATAGTFDVDIQPCVQPGAGTEANSNGWAGGFYCGNFGAVYMQLNGTNPTTGNPIGPPIDFFWVKYGRVRAGAGIQSLSFTRMSDGLRDQGNPAGPRIQTAFCIRELAPGIDGWAAHTGGGCARLPIPHTTDDNVNFSTVGPFGPAGGSNNIDGFTTHVRDNSVTGGFLAITNIYATINDHVAPTTSRNLALPFNNGTWTSGTATIGANASDAGGGVKQTRLLIQSTLQSLRTVDHTCTYSSWNPCAATQNWTSTFNTSNLSDGTYPAVYSATDAGDATTSTPAFNIRIDNTRPGTPASLKAEANGINGWSAVNEFGATWGNTGETTENTTQSGIAKVIVDINPTHLGQSDPAPVEIPVGTTVSGIAATLDSVSGVKVPANGFWTMRISLVDRAGNTSALGENGESEAGIGVNDTPAPKASGQANGWASENELIAGSVVQEWDPAPLPGPDESPVCGWALSISQNQFDDGGTVINVAGGGEPSWTVPANTPEGTNWVHIRAITCAGVPATETDHQELKVDRTDPTPSFSGVEEGRWYKSGQEVTMCGADALSGMDPEPNPLEPATAGAYITYTINGAGPAAADSPRGACATISVTGEGQKSLSFSPVDTAGNKASPTVVTFGIDASPPEGYLDDQDPQRPTLLRAVLTDAASGLSHAIIQYRPTSGGAWSSLPTSLASFSGGMVGDAPKSAIAEARFPDTRLPKGTYEIRVIAVDVAGNEFQTNKNKHGQVHTVANPMRKATGISAAIYNALRKCKRTRGSKCVKKKKGTVYLAGGKQSVTVGYRRAGVIQGFLTQGSGYAALAKQPLEIYTKVQGQAEVLDGVSSTRSDGSWYYRLKPGVSRSVRIVYPGTELLQDDEARVEFKTAAKVTLKVSKRKAKTGGKVTFTGKITATDRAFPARGKIIALQYLSGGKWRPAVAITRTTKSGKFKVHYRFDRIPKGVPAKIKFRVWAPSEIDFHHGNSASRHKVVLVNW